MRRTLRALERAVPYALSLLILAAAAAAQITDPPIRAALRNLAFDTYQRLAPREYRPAPVRVVDIDEESLKRLGQWPWPRTRIAELVEKLRQGGAAAIGFDIVFAEPDRLSPIQVARQWRNADAVLPLVRDLPDHDAELAAAIAGGGVVTGFSLGDDVAGPRPRVKARFVLGGDDPRPFLDGTPGATTSLPMLQEAAAGNGAFSFVPDEDGVIRRVPLLLKSGETIVPSLALEALRVALGTTNILVSSSGAVGQSRFGGHTGVNGLRVGSVAIETDRRGAVWPHASPPSPQRYIPAWSVLQGDGARDAEGSIVLVGTSAPGLLDLRFSPLGLVPGVDFHAQVLEQILDGSYLVRPDWATHAELAFLIVASLVVVILVMRLGAGWSAVVGLGAIAVAVGGSWHLFAAQHQLYDPLYPSLVVAAIFLVCSMTRRLQAEREQAWIRHAFSSYVSPNLVQHLIEHPDELRLGGERRECSFVMSDLAGFTALVEGSDPESLLALLNEYLDGMLEIAFRHDGTLDRIVGDAVAVMFGAPVAQPGHAARAVSCAVEMDAFARSFSAEKRAEGIALGDTRIGVHSGTVIVGNVGGRNVLDYRPLGDAINTAARLESVNRHLGTRLCISGDTARLCPGFVGRPVGTLVLKGKSHGVPAFEPIAPDRAASERIGRYLEAFGRLERQDPAALEAFAILVEQDPEDGLAAFHLERLRQGDTGTLIVLTEK